MINLDIARMQYENIQPQRAVASVHTNTRDEALHRACQDFEAIFVKQMLKSMKGTINKSGFLDGGFAEEVYDDMLYDEYADKMVTSAGFGIADTLYNQLSFSAHSEGDKYKNLYT
ncbi:MAG: rod-binding protein [Spirochaetales bacterium]|nr:rod-binding protein [Spirochaetales bacterium]